MTRDRCRLNFAPPVRDSNFVLFLQFLALTGKLRQRARRPVGRRPAGARLAHAPLSGRALPWQRALLPFASRLICAPRRRPTLLPKPRPFVPPNQKRAKHTFFCFFNKTLSTYDTDLCNSIFYKRTTFPLLIADTLD